MPDFWFFLSYARQDDRKDLIRQFFNDLEAAVKDQQEETPSENVKGFMDIEGVEPGQEWEPSLAEALRSSRVFVPLYSPTYFMRPYCGKEFQVFGEYHQRRPKQSISLILPVQWRLKRTAMPEAASKIQHDHGDYPETYRTEGLFVLLNMYRTYEDEYKRFVEKFATKLVSAATSAGPANRAALPSLADVPNAFAAPSGPPGAKQDPASGPQNIKFIFLTGSKEQMKAVRKNWEVFYGVQSDRRDWKPYSPDLDKEVGLLAQEVVTSLDKYWEFLPHESDRDLIARIREAEEKNNVVLILVDPWSVKLERCEQFLLQYDASLFSNCALLVHWNEKDEESRTNQELRNALRDRLRRHLKLRLSNTYFRDGIGSREELLKALAEAFHVVRSRMESTAENFRVADDGTSHKRPTIDPNQKVETPV